MFLQGRNHRDSGPRWSEVNLNHFFLRFFFLLTLNVSESLVAFLVYFDNIRSFKGFDDTTHQFFSDVHQIVIISVSPIEFA
jgi:hypothetical protein